MYTIRVNLIPILSESKIVPRMVKPHRKLFVRVTPHDPAHLLNVRRQTLGKGSCRYAYKHIRHIKSLGQYVCGYQPMNLCVGLREVFDHLLLELIVILIADRDEVIA